MVDYHVHTWRCGHASGEDREYVETAIRKGLKELGFSDHVPRFYEPDNPEKRLTERGMSRNDLEDYVKTVLNFKSEYKELNIRLGLEVDYVSGWEEEIYQISRLYPWDYILGSVHFIPEWDYGYIGFDKTHTPAEIYPAYLNKVAQAGESKLFNILAHIDLPRRFFPRLDESVMNQFYQGLAARLGKVGAVVELNTYGIRSSKHGDVGVFPDEPLLALLRLHGIKVTAGSDAHTPEEVGSDFDRVAQLLRTVGYDKITTFSKGVPYEVKWDVK